MFRGRDGFVLISSDFSQQEPRTLAHMSHDEHLIQAYIDGKDIYAWIAEKIYKVQYEECKEFRPDGTKNPEGAKRRSSVKSIILGRPTVMPHYSEMGSANLVNPITQGCAA